MYRFGIIRKANFEKYNLTSVNSNVKTKIYWRHHSNAYKSP